MMQQLFLGDAPIKYGPEVDLLSITICGISWPIALKTQGQFKTPDPQSINISH